jgi:hypothetical protein
MFISLLAQPSSFKRKETSIYSCILHPALPVVKQQTGFLFNLPPHDYRVGTTGDAREEGRTERSVSKAHPSLCSRFWMKEERVGGMVTLTGCVLSSSLLGLSGWFTVGCKSGVQRICSDRHQGSIIYIYTM